MSYDPRNWYWAADDGRVYSSARQQMVTTADDGFAAAEAAKLITRWPVDDSGAQTTASLQEVLSELGLSADLGDRKNRLCDAIDAQAEAQRGLYVTDGSGQAMVYLQKQTQAAQALAGLEASPAMTAAQGAAAFALLAAEVGITVDPSTKTPASDVFGVARAVAITVAMWLPIAAAIEGMRLRTKAAIMAAATADAAQAAFAAVAWPAPPSP